MIYKPKEGSPLTLEQAQRYGERISALVEENNGEINSIVIVDDAKNDTSPLHDYFEWDEKRAAHKFRLEQARHLLKSINVVVKSESGNETEIRAFHNVIVEDESEFALDGERLEYKEGHHRTYVQLDRIMSEDDLRQQIIKQAVDYLKSWKKKYEQYKELAPIVKAIDTVQEELKL